MYVHEIIPHQDPGTYGVCISHTVNELLPCFGEAEHLSVAFLSSIHLPPFACVTSPLSVTLALVCIPYLPALVIHFLGNCPQKLVCSGAGKYNLRLLEKVLHGVLPCRLLRPGPPQNRLFANTTRLTHTSNNDSIRIWQVSRPAPISSSRPLFWPQAWWLMPGLSPPIPH